MLKRIHGIVSGKVQKVFFRAFIEKNAVKLKLTGWVRNLNNGCVEFIAEGNETALKKLIEKTKKGNHLSKVNSVKINWSEFKNEFKEFQRKQTQKIPKPIKPKKSYLN